VIAEDNEAAGVFVAAGRASPRGFFRVRAPKGTVVFPDHF